MSDAIQPRVTKSDTLSPFPRRLVRRSNLSSKVSRQRELLFDYAGALCALCKRRSLLRRQEKVLLPRERLDCLDASAAEK